MGGLFVTEILVEFFKYFLFMSLDCKSVSGTGEAFRKRDLREHYQLGRCRCTLEPHIQLIAAALMGFRAVHLGLSHVILTTIYGKHTEKGDFLIVMAETFKIMCRFHNLEYYLEIC